MRAFLALREGVHYRREAFAAGLARCGFEVVDGLTMKPRVGDLLCIWNRYGEFHQAALAFEASGLPVLVAENGYLGNDFCGDRWYAISLNQHNGAGAWPNGGPERWDSLGVELKPFRLATAGELVILPQRGIGPPGVAMPRDWLAGVERTLKKAGDQYRVRHHPGTRAACPLEQDLANAGAVITWGSGAALKALCWGINVYSDFPRWIGHSNNADASRLAMFRRLAWAQWRLSEIESGAAFRALLEDR